MKYILSAIVISMFVIAGCSGETAGEAADEVSQDEQSPNPQASQASVPTAERQTDSPAVSKADVSPKLKAMMENSVSFRVTYDVTAGGEKSQMTQYIRGTDVRTDVIVEEMEVRSFMLDGKYTTCNQATGSWMCQEIDYKPSEGEDIENKVKENPEDYEITSLPSRTVAGVSTECYRVAVEKGTVDYCYSADYVPLYIKTDAGMASSELIAKSYTTKVSDADFVLPAEPGAAINPADYMKNLPNY